ncbi:Uncharacterized signaling protein CC_0091 [uncultured Pleomorphomonas sp.]|uniref:Uncharacterized signaling protein CC_0091 n=1 Tax=uncultured Pleomorphomonas sp. TaxID=442121 RepID=A0A212LNA7_9HYPH|nr:EAL domain-containing protein [uncultured Pleomorphomonas sp.]SCM79026.1 Uncharacterized signaling protein CC_0091 [uncultured Pleomorphomonas sp.]
MFRIIACIQQQHDPRLVALAAGICLLGSFTFFLLLRRAGECRPGHREGWLALAAVAGGIGVWSTHFVAMLAYHSAPPLSFALWPTVFSVVFIVLVWWAALSSLFFRPGAKAATVLGLLVTFGIAWMHVTGMAAIEIAARVSYDWPVYAAGMAAAAILIAAAMAMRGRFEGAAQLAAPMLLMVLGIVTLHFSGMAAVRFEPDPTLVVADSGLHREWLTVTIAGATVLLVCAAALAVVLDRYVTDLKGLIDAAFEGFMIVRAGVITQVNQSLCELSGHGAAELVGRRLDRLVLLDDGGDGRLGRENFETVLWRADGERRIVEVSAHTVEFRGHLCMVVSLRDLTDRRAAERQIEHMARHDGLTGLPNRHLLDERLADALARARAGGRAVSVLALDLDRFKAVNDIFGHAKGDEILCKVADMLRASVRATDTVARVGGDEFLIVQDGIASHAEAETLALRLLEDFAREMDMTRNPMAVGVSIGAALFPTDAEEADVLKHHADIALYSAKQSGRGNVCFFAPSMDREVRARRQMEHDLRLAVQRHQTFLAYQPMVASASGEIVGYEALLRWRHPELGEVPPEVFIPVAEESGSIVQLGEWVLTAACHEAAGWAEPLTVAVNVSPVQFQLPNLAAIVEGCLRRSGLAPHRLQIEVTEAALMRDPEAVRSIFRQLKALGVGIVMDDFGTGYSSLNSLQSFPFDKIKIDKSFIGALEGDEAARSVVKAIVGLGRSLNLAVVAEGIETEAQWRLVVEEGCPEAQGYLFGFPEVSRSSTELPPAAAAASRRQGP